MSACARREFPGAHSRERQRRRIATNSKGKQRYHRLRRERLATAHCTRVYNTATEPELAARQGVADGPGLHSPIARTRFTWQPIMWCESWDCGVWDVPPNAHRVAANISSQVLGPCSDLPAASRRPMRLGARSCELCTTTFAKARVQVCATRNLLRRPQPPCAVYTKSSRTDGSQRGTFHTSCSHEVRKILTQTIV